jgi:uncharacterized protein YbjT (DUF2867 family)
MMADVLVTGGSGNVGRHLVRSLCERGVPVRAAVRTPGAAEAPALAATPASGSVPQACSIVQLDFLRPETYARAFSGVERLFLMRPPHLADVRRQLAPAITAARDTGVRHVVVLSLLGAERNPIVPHRHMEDHVRKVGLPYTLLRPSFFMQNLTTTHLPEIRDQDELFMPAGRGRTSFIDARDIAEVAARVLTEPGHGGKAYPLTGSQALTYDDVASTLSAVLRRPIVYRPASLVGFARRMRSRGLAWGYIGVMAGIYTTCRLGLAGAVTQDAARLLGREPTTLWQFAQDHRGLWSRDIAGQ